MLRQKIDYAIDLGTTNSSIARMDNGELRIFNIEPYKKTIMPSCVHFTKWSQIYVGDLAYNKLFLPKETNTFGEFKRTMGSDDKYYSSNTGKYYTSEELSAEVLKQLKQSVKDEEFSSAIITVPADFDQVQVEATRRAAEMAGFEYFELLQEPIAASLAFLRDKKNIEGIWIVFDFGGGTFDAALVKMETGIMRVIDHAGDNHLGGKNMDLLIVDEKVIPCLKDSFNIENILGNDKAYEELERAWKPYAERTKIDLSEKDFSMIDPDPGLYKDDNGKEMDLPIRLDRSEFEKLIAPLIERAINICRLLLNKNNLLPSELLTVLMVGGPTLIPFLRESVMNRLCNNIDISIDPMTAVAQGAAIYASTRPIPSGKRKKDYSRIQIILAYPDTTVEKEITLGIKIDKKLTSISIPSKLFIEVTKSDRSWTSGKVEIKDGVGILRLHLAENTTNGFSVRLFDDAGNMLECEPNTISILQGIKLAQPPLPHDIGISAIHLGSQNEELMIPLLKKGTPLPASEKKTFFLQKNIRPGNSSDMIKIIVWEGVGQTRPVRNVHMGEIVISGRDLSSLSPEGSKVEITMRMDESRLTKVSAYFPYLDETVEGVVNPDYTYSALSASELSSQISAEKERLDELREKMIETDQLDDSELKKIENFLLDLDNSIEKGRGDSDRSREVQDRLNEVAIKLDSISDNLKWPQMEKEINEELGWTKDIIDRFGNDKDRYIYSQLEPEINKAIGQENVRLAKEALEKIHALKYKILFEQPGYWASVLKNIAETSEQIEWSDRIKANTLIDRGCELLASGRFSDEIKNIVRNLWDLMPVPDREKTKKPRTDIPIYK